MIQAWIPSVWAEFDIVQDDVVVLTPGSEVKVYELNDHTVTTDPTAGPYVGIVTQDFRPQKNTVEVFIRGSE